MTSGASPPPGLIPIWVRYRAVLPLRSLWAVIIASRFHCGRAIIARTAAHRRSRSLGENVHCRGLKDSRDVSCASAAAPPGMIRPPTAADLSNVRRDTFEPELDFTRFSYLALPPFV